MKNRARFVVEVIEEVRRRVGNEFPVSLRLSIDESIRGGYTEEDMLTVIPDFVRAGADVIHASLGTYGTPGGITSAPVEFEPGFNAFRARKVKEVVDVPVIAVGPFYRSVRCRRASSAGKMPISYPSAGSSLPTPIFS
jgi:2,4-dienoyl-CoA reductase-like NADH-dependent reductase (Old Yellow Enzyme family)